MARIDASLTQVLESVVARLHDQIDTARGSNCYLSLDPDMIVNGRPGDHFFIVTPLDGNFDDAFIAGGGQQQATVDSTFTVTIHSVRKKDRAGESSEFLNSETTGIITLGTDVLQALVSHDLVDLGGDEVGFEPISPISYNVGQKGDGTSGWLQIAFNVLFDWDLS
tara:strand:+ start:465 stop:962 length:498 start_codon:yes stop_codon:yes gene_type:complete